MIIGLISLICVYYIYVHQTKLNYYIQKRHLPITLI